MKTRLLLLVLISGILLHCKPNETAKKQTIQTISSTNTITIPSLIINGKNTHDIVKAYRIAIGDVSGNIQYHKSGVLEQKEPCLYAGLIYGKPWTRDAAINVWNGFGLLSPEVSKNTLLAQLEKSENGETTIIGQYWDKIIWTIGAWNYYLYSGDTEFLLDIYKVTQNTLNQLEENEFSEEFGLFRGPAVYGDGVAAYPKIYTRSQDKSKNGSYSGIYQWPEENKDLKFPKGFGIPMHALSTNAVYYQVYSLMSKIETELNKEPNKSWKTKAEKLKKAINKNFWNEKKNNYNYLVDPFGNSDAQESMGISFSLLFDITEKNNIDKIFKNTKIEPAGIPCVYPTFKRFRNEKLDSYGRHSGTVWPHIQGFWADAAMKNNKPEIFLHEFNALTRHALRDFQFVEIYHPTKETAYGGIQEPHLKEWTTWFCAERQSWSATAYLSMIFKNIIGMDFSEKGITFSPFLPKEINDVEFLGLKYRNSIIDIHISGSGNKIEQFSVNGKKSDDFFLSKDLEGKITVEITLTES
ncbi:hypothetical protein H9I45_15570 [Polaribacter haliotis]|uniref:Alpha-L-rhamnosidase six-hairpin glycosidase domain-containing protein n=1 Tax=Polaribacter haliotis TaxID=1888915 RepID=A0A7L8AFF4_9FLAO|nr:amylo-alpha-1,6-glucosidase [Polaribacter haliotis]QOD60738.1 hypothetical protein H9I45_15570 [Polaribacter haliotis]